MRLQDKLVRLRAQAGLSQEKLAAEMEVSRQTVQKWESGAATPEIEKLTRLARRFGVSLDALLLDGDRRGGEEMRGDTLIQPEYAAMHEWESYAACLPTEFRQCMEEGKDVGAYEGLFREVARMPAGPLKTRMADILFELTQRTPQRKDYPFDEPSDLQEIQALRPAAQPGRRPRPENAEMADRLMGAWLGRIAGCLLGKPIEELKLISCHLGNGSSFAGNGQLAAAPLYSCKRFDDGNAAEIHVSPEGKMLGGQHSLRPVGRRYQLHRDGPEAAGGMRAGFQPGGCCAALAG